MNDSPNNPLEKLEHELSAGLKTIARKSNYDVLDEEKELEAINAFPLFYNALEFFNKSIYPKWSEADKMANTYQKKHQTLARIAIATGIGAIILAIVQLGLKQTLPHYSFIAVWLEGFVVFAGASSVVIGLRLQSDKKWLINRYHAEQLRMIKFKAISRVDWMKANEEEWKKWIQDEVEKVVKVNKVDKVDYKEWVDKESIIPKLDALNKEAKHLDDNTMKAIVMYYRYKRLSYQYEYFTDKSKSVATSWIIKAEHHRNKIFFATVGVVMFHFFTDYLSMHLKYSQFNNLENILEAVSVWCVVFAAIIPVAGIGAHAWTGALELSRKMRSFKAKSDAMNEADSWIRTESRNIPKNWIRILGLMQNCEMYLEQEHREWLRNLIAAEWFL